MDLNQIVGDYVLQIVNLKKNHANFESFQLIVCRLLKFDSQFIKFALRELAKFIIPKKEKIKYLEFANYLIKQDNIPPYLLSEIFEKKNCPNYRDYLKYLGQIGFNQNVYFFVKFNHKAVDNFLFPNMRNANVPSIITRHSFECEIVPAFKIVKRIMEIEIKYEPPARIYINCNLIIIEYYECAKIIEIPQSQVFTVIKILLLLDIKKYLKIIIFLFREFVEQTPIFNFSEFFEFLVEYDLYEMIKYHQNFDIDHMTKTAKLYRYNYNIIKFFYFNSIPNHGKIPDEFLCEALKNASPRVQALYGQTSLSAFWATDIIDATDLPIELGSIIYEYTREEFRDFFSNDNKKRLQDTYRIQFDVISRLIY